MTELPEMVPVASTNVAAIGYSDEHQCLFVQFTNGRIYAYPHVSVELYDQFLAAPSKGQFMNQHVKPLPCMRL